jgi:hypothetical protein
VVTISRSKTHQNTEGEGTYAENNFKKLCFDKTSDQTGDDDEMEQGLKYYKPKKSPKYCDMLKIILVMCRKMR